MANINIEEERTVTNPTALAAAAIEEIISGTQRVDYYNEIKVQNGDAVKIRVTLNTNSADFFDVEPKTVAGFTYDTGKRFSYVSQQNMDAVTAETAGLIIFTVSKKVEE